MLGHLKCLDDFGVGGRIELVILLKEKDRRCRLDSHGFGYEGISGGLL